MSDIPSSDWSQSDDDNDATTPNGWPEGQSPGSVNNCARAMMGAIKRWYAWSTPATTGGTNTAYTLTYGTAPAALVDGMTFLVSVDQACGSSPTLNVNSLGAKNLQKYVGSSWSDLAAGDVQADQIVRVTYNNTAGKFRVISPLNVVPTGASLPFRGTSDDVPAGFVLEDGKTIGDADSGATGRAAADCEALFKLLWGNSNYTLQDSSGTASTKGATADADWTAHKRLILSDMSNNYRRGNTTSGGGSGGSTSLSSGTATGSLTVTGSTSNLSAASVTLGHGNGNGAGSDTTSAAAGTHSLNSGNLTVSGTTSGTLSVSGTVTPPYVYELSIIKL